MATISNLQQSLGTCRALHDALGRPCIVQGGGRQWQAFAGVVVKLGQWLLAWVRHAGQSAAQDNVELAQVTDSINRLLASCLSLRQFCEPLGPFRSLVYEASVCRKLGLACGTLGELLRRTRAAARQCQYWSSFQRVESEFSSLLGAASAVRLQPHPLAAALRSTFGGSAAARLSCRAKGTALLNLLLDHDAPPAATQALLAAAEGRARGQEGIVDPGLAAEYALLAQDAELATTDDDDRRYLHQLVEALGSFVVPDAQEDGDAALAAELQSQCSLGTGGLLTGEEGEEDDNVPDDFVCAISQEVMREPVTIQATGQTYDRHSIIGWFKQRRSRRQPLTCPSTNMEVDCPTLVANTRLKQRIEEWQAAHGRVTSAAAAAAAAAVHTRSLSAASEASSTVSSSGGFHIRQGSAASSVGAGAGSGLHSRATSHASGPVHSRAASVLSAGGGAGGGTPAAHSRGTSVLSAASGGGGAGGSVHSRATSAMSCGGGGLHSRAPSAVSAASGSVHSRMPSVASTSGAAAAMHSRGASGWTDGGGGSPLAPPLPPRSAGPGSPLAAGNAPWPPAPVPPYSGGGGSPFAPYANAAARPDPTSPVANAGGHGGNGFDVDSAAAMAHFLESGGELQLKQLRLRLQEPGAPQRLLQGRSLDPLLQLLWRSAGSGGDAGLACRAAAVVEVLAGSSYDARTQLAQLGAVRPLAALCVAGASASGTYSGMGAGQAAQQAAAALAALATNHPPNRALMLQEVAVLPAAVSLLRVGISGGGGGGSGTVPDAARSHAASLLALLASNSGRNKEMVGEVAVAPLLELLGGGGGSGGGGATMRTGPHSSSGATAGVVVVGGGCSASTREAVAGAIRSLSLSDGNRRRIVSGGGVALLVAIVHGQGCASKACQEAAAVTLGYLAMSAQVRSQVVTPAAVSALVGLLGSEAEGCREAAAGALARMAEGDAASRQRVAGAGAARKVGALLLKGGSGPGSRGAGETKALRELAAALAAQH